MSGFAGIVSTFRHRDYARYVSGNALSLTGTWMHRIAVGWLTWELTGSTAWLGIIAMAELFPAVFLGPIGGALADRYNRVRIMVWAQSAAMTVAAALFALSVGGHLSIGVLTALTLINGIGVGLHQASRLALAPSLVPAEHLTTAIAINSMVFNLARFTGPVIAGALIGVWRIEGAFAVNAVSYLPLIWALSSLRLPGPVQGAGRHAVGGLFADIADGIRFAARHPSTAPLLLMLVVTALCLRPLIELLPGFADAVFGLGAEGFTALVAATGLGALLGGLWMAAWGGRAEAPYRALSGTFLACVAIVCLLLSPWFAMALVFAFVAGLGLTVAGVGTQSTLQFVVDGRMRGRVLSLYGVIFIGGPAIGALLIGVVAEWSGLRPPLVLAALAAGGVWVWAWSKRHAISGAMEQSAPLNPTR